MSAGTSASFCLVVCLLVWSSEAQEQFFISAEPGQEVILPCNVTNNNEPVTAVEWNRPGLDPDYVLLYRDGRLNPVYQHPSYRNRVDLQDEDMEDGDVSLVLNNVTMEDTGTYECRVFQEGTNRWKRSSLTTKTTDITFLKVQPGSKDGGDKDGGDKVGGDKDGGNMVGGDKVGGDKDGGDTYEGDKVGIVLGPVVLILLAVISSGGFLIYKRLVRQKSNLPVPPDDPADVQMF